MTTIIMELIVLYFLALIYYIPLIYIVWGDVIGLLIKIFKLKKEPRGYETTKLFLKCEEYRKHKKTWYIKFLYPLIACGMAWIVFKLIGMEDAGAIIHSHFVMIVSYTFCASQEAKARKIAKQEFLNREIVYPSIETKFEFNYQRKTPVADGYRVDHKIDEKHIAIGIHHYYDCDKVLPGETAFGTITFIAPEYYPHSLYVGKELIILEGERIVGYATVLKINSPILEKTRF